MRKGYLLTARGETSFCSKRYLTIFGKPELAAKSNAVIPPGSEKQRKQSEKMKERNLLCKMTKNYDNIKLGEYDLYLFHPKPHLTLLYIEQHFENHHGDKLWKEKEKKNQCIRYITKGRE